jgi:hypothetical protein
MKFKAALQMPLSRDFKSEKIYTEINRANGEFPYLPFKYLKVLFLHS